MANTTCDVTQYVTDPKLFASQALNPAQQKAILVYAKALLLFNAGGTDYTSALTSTLLSDASAIACGMSKPQIDAAKIVVWVKAAGLLTAFGVVGDLTTPTKCLVNADPLILEKADLMLTCKILNQFGY